MPLRLTAAAIAVALALPGAAGAPPFPDDPEFDAVYEDGPYSYLPESLGEPAELSAVELAAMLERDGEAGVSAEEAEMRALMRQVLFADPTQAPAALATLDRGVASVKPVAGAGL